MPKRRVLLLRAPSLLAEGIERLVRQMEDVELIGPWDLNAQWSAQFAQAAPDIVLVVEEGAGTPDTSALINQILKQHPDLPIVHVGMQQNTIRLYTSRALPARASELVDLIRNLPLHQLEELESQA